MLFFTAESHLLEYAKLAAARNAFIGITEREFYPTKFFTGEECDPSLEYTFSESESHLTVTRIEVNYLYTVITITFLIMWKSYLFILLDFRILIKGRFLRILMKRNGK